MDVKMVNISKGIYHIEWIKEYNPVFTEEELSLFPRYKEDIEHIHQERLIQVSGLGLNEIMDMIMYSICIPAVKRIRIKRESEVILDSF